MVHALVFEPAFRGRKQGHRYLRIIDRFIHAELSQTSVNALLNHIADLGADPTDRLLAAVGDPEA